ncbi:allantoate amidohydrolase [Alsobacter sp. SYSU M60028]|uniref:Allantoate amidohydrolase n=1 Tax=Alsobacter ponti TaxID=2962936 RepID=A0ABT1L826_9HYPH|nr:allantoate amidohydrolase [Alsobacter ponti]MCP8937086.1 allantoate amidohydrolase [Alsobacter ponti]
MTDGAKGGERLMARLKELSRFTAQPGEMTRLYLTPEHRQAADQVAAWMREAGMEVAMDAAGTVVGRYPAAAPGGKTMLLGSHIDTVRNAGIYDGNLGVLAAIEAVARLHERGERLPFAIEVLAFGDEEGVRFPVTLTSSRALAGLFDPASLDARDDDGVSLREALVAFGLDPDGIAALRRDPSQVIGYLEAHIEQGPVLEAQGAPVGVVTAIAGATRAVVEVSGVAGHAGTVPMALRRDAGTAAAEMVLAVERLARETTDLVATVGQLQFQPGAVNVIPSGVRFTLDCRSPRDEIRDAAIRALSEQFSEIAKQRNVTVEVRGFYDEPAAKCAEHLVASIEQSIAERNIQPIRLTSGAGHDGLAMVALCPIGMIFVRCRGGISHNPAEHITTEDAGVAVDVLVDVLRRLARRNDPTSMPNSG